MLQALAIPGLEPNACVQGEAIRRGTQSTTIGSRGIPLPIRAVCGGHSERAVTLDGCSAQEGQARRVGRLLGNGGNFEPDLAAKLTRRYTEKRTAGDAAPDLGEL